MRYSDRGNLVHKASVVALFFAVLLQVLPARADIHIVQINEVMAGLNGDGDIQFVEIEMLAFHQSCQGTGNQGVGEFNCDTIGPGARLVFFDAAGAQTLIPFSTVQKGHYSGVREPLKIVIQTQEQWVAFWTRHVSIKANPPPPPCVDFATEMVVGVFLGEKRTGGYGIEITRVEKDTENRRLNVYFREAYPPRNAMIIQLLTQPYHVVKTKKVGLPVDFRSVGESSNP